MNILASDTKQREVAQIDALYATPVLHTARICKNTATDPQTGFKKLNHQDYHFHIASLLYSSESQAVLLQRFTKLLYHSHSPVRATNPRVHSGHRIAPFRQQALQVLEVSGLLDYFKSSFLLHGTNKIPSSRSQESQFWARTCILITYNVPYTLPS